MMRFISLFLFSFLAVSSLAAQRVSFVWPAPETPLREGVPATEILQHAGSGDPKSGGFGGVRSGGKQFHEGIDIKPRNRDRAGNPTDRAVAAMDGVVRHISAVAGKSSYGRYVVLEHTEVSPAVYTLYAHLAQITPGLRVGNRIQAGEPVGTIGRSAGGYVIPKDRAHLHFEIGLMMTRDFQRWYDSRKFGSRNEHNIWNGMNLMGVDALDFYTQWRAGRVANFEEYFRRLPPAVALRISTRRVPDFVTRYPALLTKPLPDAVGGWEIQFDWTGLPFAWTPLTPMQVLDMKLQPNQPVIVRANEPLIRRERSKTLATKKQGDWVIGSDLKTVLQQLFAIP